MKACKSDALVHGIPKQHRHADMHEVLEANQARYWGPHMIGPKSVANKNKVKPQSSY
jgi:hypothetical protein